MRWLALVSVADCVCRRRKGLNTGTVNTKRRLGLRGRALGTRVNALLGGGRFSRLSGERSGEAGRWLNTYHATIVFWHKQIDLPIYRQIQNIISISRKTIVSSRPFYSSFINRREGYRTPYWKALYINIDRESNEHHRLRETIDFSSRGGRSIVWE